MKEQAYQKTIKSIIILKNGGKLSSDGVGGCSSGELRTW
jgi:hypothetical protein